MTDFSKKALGCLPPHPADKSKRVSFASVFGTNLQPPEPARDWTDGDTTRPEFGNDNVGDCTIAAIANIIIGALKESFGKEWYPTTDEALALYSEITGYNPSAHLIKGENPTDTGAVIEDVLKYVMNNGAFGHHFIGTAAIDPGNVADIKRAVDWFGCVDLGVDLPIAWQDADSWTMDGYFPLDKKWAPGSWGGHSVCSEKYDVDFLYVWSWGKIIPVSWDAVRSYFTTVDAVLTASWIKRGRSPANLDLSVLEERMAKFKA
jgi:hypothetical protein